MEFNYKYELGQKDIHGRTIIGRTYEKYICDKTESCCIYYLVSPGANPNWTEKCIENNFDADYDDLELAGNIYDYIGKSYSWVEESCFELAI